MRTLSLITALTLIVLSGCKEIDKLTQFEMEFTESVVIESTSAINLPFNIIQPDIETNASSTFQSNNTRKELIEEIRLTQLDLTLTSPDNGNFDFLKTIKIFLNASGLDEIEIASYENVPEGSGQYIELSVSGADLKEYIKKEEFTLRLNTVTDETITADHYIDVHSVFFVDAEVLGQ